MPDLAADGTVNGTESLRASCLHVISNANAKVLDCLLACDEADVGKGSNSG